MELIELVVKLPVKTINRIKSTYGHGKCCGMFDDDRVTIVKAIVNGFPLPKGHGALIDRTKLMVDFTSQYWIEYVSAGADQERFNKHKEV